MAKNILYVLNQYDQAFSQKSRVNFGVYNSFARAIDAKDLLFGMDNLQENGEHSWISNDLNYGLMIQEIELNKAEESRI